MQNNKQDRAIIFIANQQYSFALASMLINLRDNLSLDYQVVVYHFGIPEIEQLALSSISDNIKFIEYTYDNWLKDHNITNLNSRLFKNFINRFTHLALSKYIIFEQLAFYRQVLYLDLDMLLLDNISDIFKLKGIAWRTESVFHKKFGNKDNRPCSEGLAKVPEDFPTPNGGLVYISEILDWEKCFYDGRKFINKYAAHFGSVIDELSLSWIAFNNELKINELNYRIYNTLPNVANEHTKIIHFMGKQKTWNNELLNYGFPTWFKNYMQATKKADYKFSGNVDTEMHGHIYRKLQNKNDG